MGPMVLFQEILKLNLTGLKVVDVGSGSGELLKYIIKRLDGLGKKNVISEYYALDAQSSLKVEFKNTKINT